VNDAASGNASGYMLKFTSKGVKIGTAKLNCPTGYITVPGNPIYQTEDFCVMKYEAKNVSSVATSEALGTPWVSVTQTAAITACSSLGSNYHLITNNEWLTIVRNIEQVASNWTSGIVGTGAVYSGHNDSIPGNALAANADDNQGYDGTGETAPANQRRTHILSNGESIWDLAGNVWEWNSNVISCAAANCTSAEMPYDASPASEWVEFTNLTGHGQLSYDLIRPSNATWNATQGFGRIYTDVNAANPSGNVHGFIRGGVWIITSSAGVFALSLAHSPSDSNAFTGFRCAVNL
jgi:formylglycine-generating enzyme required for sulfatase activity